ncbi:histidine kinase [Ornithinimicrobium tianjinense]|uniref:histidine kinase n=1 Tax=Ornithinimicrobium tianjinense TaxID=1195761 RepID=A0A917F2E3_9MICO|nr:histidine kinase [Ornithinimicrobium tianjinense]GGF46268.1 hypothetical protein GCM10011366_12490 [Ornithinimicrobium tianjinense]
MKEAGPPTGRRGQRFLAGGLERMGIYPARRAVVARDALVLVASALLATVTAPAVRVGPPTPLLWLAGVYVYGAAGVLVVRALDGYRAARESTRAHSDRLARMARESPEPALREERRRLAGDIRRVLLDALTEIREIVAEVLTAGAAGPDVEVAVTQLRSRTHLAASELRRLLGILRAAEGQVAAGSGDQTQGQRQDRPPRASLHPEDSPQPLGRPRRRDVVEALLLTALAVVECVIDLPGRPGGLTATPVVLTAAAAAAFAWRAASPVLTAVAQGLLFAVGFWAAAPLVSGVWLVRGVGAVLWAAATSRPTWPGTGAALFLTTTVLGTRQQEPTIGVIATWGVVLVALSGGLVAAAHGRRAALERRETDVLRRARAAELHRAVGVERVRLARELHDAVSHSVGVISMQLNVLDVVTDPAQRERTLRSIRQTCDGTLDELLSIEAHFLGGLSPLPPTRTMTDVSSLLDRLRASGLVVDVRAHGTPDPRQLPVVYRLLQEALTNVLQHAPGAAAHVLIDVDERGTRLLVRDDGPGVQPGVGRRHHYGMVGLRERVELAGGTLSLGPAGPEGGFCVSAFLPAGPRLGTEEVDR